MASLISYEDWMKMGQSVSLKDGKVFYVRKGKGLPLVMLHSYGGNSWWFSRVIDSFARHLSVFAMDLPGCAQSETPPRPYGPEEYADTVEQFMDRLGIKKMHLLSNHGSGFTAAHFAITRPERVTKLVLDCMPFWTLEEGAKFWERAQEQWLDQNELPKPLEQWPGAGNRFSHLEPEERKAASQRVSQDIMEHGRFWVTVLKGEFRYQINHRLHLIQAPTLLVNGETDWHREGEDRILKGIKGARMEIIPRSGGIPAFEQPEAYAKVVLDFLRAPE